MSQCSVVPAFMAAAKDLLETSGVSAEVLLAKALAKTAVGLSLTKPLLLFVSKQSKVLKRFGMVVYCRASRR